MSVIADRLAALQYVQAWTAHVDLEICKPVDGEHVLVGSNLVLKRRRESVFVCEPVDVTFPPDEMLGQSPVLPPPPTGRRLTPQTMGPRSGWAVTCPSGVWVSDIRLIKVGSDEVGWHRGSAHVRGVTRGSIVVPLGYRVVFTLERSQYWENNITRILEASKK